MSEPAARRILIVDDENSIREVCRRVLSPRGFRVIAAATGQEALAHLRQERIDAVLTDMAMPGEIDGAGLLERLRTHWPTIPVIIMTAFPDLQSAIGALRGGAVDYLVKPFSREELCAAVTRCLGQSPPVPAPEGG